MLSGTYLLEDVQFLLKEININSTSLENKEFHIQKNKQHYSNMLTFEEAPTSQYMDLFHTSLTYNGEQFAHNIVKLSQKIAQNYNKEKEIVIVSLARAGTPIGVLVKKYLTQFLSKNTTHYSISIIRDIGIDNNALSFILQKHKDSTIAFVDGWTGKGIIGQQLNKSILDFNLQHHTAISSNLYVVADISGTAYYASTYTDYLLPSSILNSTISGLVSRTIYNPDYLSANDFHGCVIYDNLKTYDISTWFINYIFNIIQKINCTIFINNEDIDIKKSLNMISSQNLIFFKEYLNINNINFIKPGIGEATRVMLRRIPEQLWIKNPMDPQIQHLVYLAKIKQISLHIKKDLAYNAVAIIKELD